MTTSERDDEYGASDLEIESVMQCARDWGCTLKAARYIIDLEQKVAASFVEMNNRLLTAEHAIRRLERSMLESNALGKDPGKHLCREDGVSQAKDEVAKFRSSWEQGKKK